MTVEKKAAAPSGWLMLCALVLAAAADVALYLWSCAGLALGTDDATFASMLLAAIVLTGVIAVLCCGFFTIQPGQARVCVLFGNYVGTVRSEGFHWANPFFSRRLGNPDDGAAIEDLDDVKGAVTSKGLSTKVSVRARTLNGERLKVNDKVGNPIEIADVVVWHVEDTAKALFDVDDYPSYVAMQAETALRHVASVYPYDHTGDSSDACDVITLRSNVEEVSSALRDELSCRLEAAGVTVDDARLTHLAYASEIAQAMLRRQQAEAVIAARRKIVEGAVGMVEMAVNELAEGGSVDLDDERRAAMASNLMVVLCGDSEAHPVINTGSLY